MTRQIKGVHLLLMMVAFFGVVIAVNATMATFATRTFGGTVVDNSYVASQQFNTWLARAEAQRRTGASISLAVTDRIVTVDARSAGLADEGATLTGWAIHPLGRAEPVALRFQRQGSGHFVATAPLPAGRWQLELTLQRGGDRARFTEEVAA
jgi:nitrogen fixation protein FixH